MPLNKRGWLLQERLLSPRTLTFTPSQVLFDSPDFAASETFPNGYLTQNNTMEKEYQRPRPESTYTILQTQEKFPHKPTEDLRQDMLRDWDIVVALYTACSLSRQSEKLIAIKGPEQQFRRNYRRYLDGCPREDCIAGVWRSAMPRALAWRVTSYSSAPRGERVEIIHREREEDRIYHRGHGRLRQRKCRRKKPG